MSVFFQVHPNIIKANHNTTDIVKVVVMCLVEVKTYGNSPKKLLKIIKINIEVTKDPNILLFLIITFVSFTKYLIKLSKINFILNLLIK